MSKYLKEFEKFGVSVVNTNLICKDWCSRFSISNWENFNTKEVEYTLLIEGRKHGVKTRISEQQATEIIEKASLLYLKSEVFNSVGSYRDKETLEKELKRVEKLKHDKAFELKALVMYLNKLESALN